MLRKSGRESSGSGTHNDSTSSLDHSQRSKSSTRRKKEAEDPLQSALLYFKEVEAGTPWRGNYVLEKHLDTIERTAFNKGLPPEGIDIMIDFALGLRMGSVLGVRVMKTLIPATVVPQSALIKGVSWFCVGKLPSNLQVMFFRWFITVFDLVDSKEQLHLLYGFLFCFLTDEHLCPYICHLLYLLTTKESVKHYRIRRLLDLQAKIGKQPYLQALLSLYKVFCPELVTFSMPTKIKSAFKNYDSNWKTAIAAVQKKSKVEILMQLPNNIAQKTTSRKRKWNSNLNVPFVSSSVSEINNKTSISLSRNAMLPLEQLRTFSQLLQNVHRIEFPAQMGSVLNSPLLLHYINCVTDDSVFLRLDYWLGHALQEEFLFCKDANKQNTSEAAEFFNKLITAQQFLQEGFSSCETFIYKFLHVWNGSEYRSQILSLLSWIPMAPVTDMKQLLCEPLMLLFFSSSVFFKCSVIECLNNMLVNWLTWHSVYATEDIDMNLPGHSPMNMTLSELVNSVIELVQFTGRISTIGLHLEGYNTLLLHFVLSFYETVSDMYLKYDMPLVIMPPGGVFYPALISLDPISVNQLCHIMYRYRTNLVSAKDPELQRKKRFHISSKTYSEYNQYVVSMVNCLWKSKAFIRDNHPMGIEINPKLLNETKVAEYRNSFNIVHHPALMGYAIDFFQKCWPGDKHLNISSIKGRHWDWYLEYLYGQGFHGLRQFIESSITRVDHSVSRIGKR
ncbi:centromere protein I [Acipenser ruthenus]|uniref:centromere protein I n=1 Tax=Acipenser ruthenus TaxID=7906 RepID=UPI002741866D|nr:centromere protein I [Acipenser ruthenus]